MKSYRLYLMLPFLILCFFTIDGFAQSWSQLGMSMDGEAASDKSGSALSLSSDGKTVAIGAYDNDGNGTSSGHVRIYSYNGTQWVQKGADIDGKTDPINAGDFSGYSVSLNRDGSVVAIGAPRNDGLGVPAYSNAGHVRVYAWSGSSWVQKGPDINGATAGEWSGCAVSLSPDGNSVAIGALYFGSVSSATSFGAFRVYDWGGGNWIQRGNLVKGAVAGDQLGTSISLSGDANRVAVGAPNSAANGAASGQVLVFGWSGSEWVQMGGTINGENAGDRFGTSVSLSADGTTLVAGAPENDGSATNSGQARIYSWISSGWVKKGTDIDGEATSNRSGTSVSLNKDGSIVAVGAPQNNGNGLASGHVRVYKWNNNLWQQTGADIDGTSANCQSGASVAVDSTGSVVAIGAPNYSGSSNYVGQVKVYKSGSTNVPDEKLPWTCVVYPNPAKGFLIIEKLGNSAAAISVTSITGEQALLGVMNAGETKKELPLHQLANGLYFLKLTSIDGVFVQKFLKD